MACTLSTHSPCASVSASQTGFALDTIVRICVYVHGYEARGRRTLAGVVVDEVGHEEALVRVDRHDARLCAVDVILHDAELKHALRADAGLHRHEVAVVHLDALDAALVDVARDVDRCTAAARQSSDCITC